MPDEFGYCTVCERILPASAFRENAAMSSGLHSWCRECNAEEARQWRRENREVVEQYNAGRRRGPLELVCEECGARFLAKRKDAPRKGCPMKATAPEGGRDELGQGSAPLYQTGRPAMALEDGNEWLVVEIPRNPLDDYTPPRRGVRCPGGHARFDSPEMRGARRNYYTGRRWTE